MEITIKNKKIGNNNPCFIIAEAGVNHNGDIKLAKKLVDIAKKAGADAVKFQTFKAENFVTKSAKMADYQVKNIGKKESQFEMLKKLELKYENFPILKKYCDKKGIIFLSTPHSFDAIDFLENLVPAYKFGSGDITNIPALVHAAKKGKPIILGTGMSTLEETRNAINAIKSQKNNKIIALHCTTSYPCPPEDANLRAMQTMQKKLDCIVGYSDHALGILTSVVAVALGASVIEKHFTSDKKLPGPDHKASLDPSELTQMIKEIRAAEQILGSGEKKPTSYEEKIKKIVRKSLVAKKDIKVGETIKQDKITTKRPGIGLQPNQIKNLIGKKAKRPIKKDEILKFDMVD